MGGQYVTDSNKLCFNSNGPRITVTTPTGANSHQKLTVW